MKSKTKLMAFLLAMILLISVTSTAAFAYWEEPTAEGDSSLETTVKSYTQPVGATMRQFTEEYVAESDNLGDDFLFLIKKGDRYYAMKDVAASESSYATIPAVDVTSWVNPDGTLSVPSDTLGVAFFRYEEREVDEFGFAINGRDDFLERKCYTVYDNESDATTHYPKNILDEHLEFYIRSFTEGHYIQNLYWNAKDDRTTGTLIYNEGRTVITSLRPYQSKYWSVPYYVDLKSNGSGYDFYITSYSDETIKLSGDEVEGYLYYVDCRHQYTVRHAEYDAPTCMLKGCEEYWYCEGCNEYFKDEAMTQAWGESMPIIPATDHSWDAEKCTNCKRPVPVYSKVTNQADFNALADDTMFILVSEYGGKYYVPDLSELYLYMVDSDGDGFADVHNVDQNENDIPDYFEFDDGGEVGVYDYLEWDMDDDGDVDGDDHLAFSQMICSQYLVDRLYSNASIGATEVTMNSDGTFSHAAVKSTVELEMVDLYLKEEIDSMIESFKAHESWWTDDMRYTYECVKQFVIPNMFVTAPSMVPEERQYKQRIAEYGDTSSWGVLFYNDASSYKIYNYETESIEQPTFNGVCTQDSVVVFSTFDHMWYDVNWNRQIGQLRLRDYNGEITFVTGDDYSLEGGEYVDDENGGYWDTHDTQAAVYLYASQQPPHICEFGAWTDDENGRSHTRTCVASHCDQRETESHTMDEGVITQAPTQTEEGVKTYTCTLCSYAITESMPKIVINIENTQTGVTLDVPVNSNVYLPEGTVLNVVEASGEEVPEQVLGEIELKLEGAAKPLACYDLSLLLDGAEVQPNGTVQITLPALQQDFDYDKVVVVYIAPDGSYEECKTTVHEDGTITFETNHFSRYAVIGINEADGDGKLPVGAVIGIIAGTAALLGGGFCLYWFVIRKKKLGAGKG